MWPNEPGPVSRSAKGGGTGSSYTVKRAGLDVIPVLVAYRLLMFKSFLEEDRYCWERLRKSEERWFARAIEEDIEVRGELSPKLLYGMREYLRPRLWRRYGEPLAGDRVAVLQTGITHIAVPAPTHLCQLPGDPVGIGRMLLHP